MDEIFNHNLNRRVPLQQQQNTGRARVHQPPTSADVDVGHEGIGKDAFNDFPLRQRRHYGEHPAMRGELSQGLKAPQVDLGGGDIAGHHRNVLINAPASGVPNYPGHDGAFETHPPSTQHHHRQEQQQPLGSRGTSSTSSGWQTTAQAQMSGESDNHKKRLGKKMAQPHGGCGGHAGGVAGGAGSLLGYQGPHGGNAGGVMFAAKAAALQGRVDPLHNQVDQRGGLALETLPFVPGYGGHVPVSHENLNAAGSSTRFFFFLILNSTV